MTETAEVKIIHAAIPFIATQVGQVSVRAGNELELLSDTHWYWWLVRVRGNGSEGFVPAELVELPEERVARLNLQLNIKLPNEPLKSNLRVHERAPKRVRFSMPSLDASEESDEELSSPAMSPESLTDEAILPSEKVPKSVHIEDDKTVLHDVHIRGSEDDIGEQLMAQAL